jgi:hypothetical protein
LAHLTHAPCLLKGCLAISAIGLALVVLAAFLRQLRHSRLRAFFWPVCLLTVFWYSVGTFAVLRFGILWPTRDGEQVLYGGGYHTVTMTRAADYIYLAAWYSTSLLAVCGSRAVIQRFKVKPVG